MEKIGSVAILDAGAQYGKVIFSWKNFTFCMHLYAFDDI